MGEFLRDWTAFPIHGTEKYPAKMAVTENEIRKELKKPPRAHVQLNYDDYDKSKHCRLVILFVTVLGGINGNNTKGIVRPSTPIQRDAARFPLIDLVLLERTPKKLKFQVKISNRGHRAVLSHQSIRSGVA